jgi:hypothetical protein
VFKVGVESATRWVPVSLGKRLCVAFGCHGHLVLTGHRQRLLPLAADERSGVAAARGGSGRRR